MKEIAIEFIQFDEKIKKIRDNQNEEAIGRYMEKYESGTSKPILVKEVDRQNFILIDGHHRLEAIKRLKRRKIDVEVIDISDKDIYSKAVECNQEHGVRLNESEEEKIILELFEQGKTQEEMAKVFHVGRTTITMRIQKNPVLKKSMIDKTNISTINEILIGTKQSDIANNYSLTQGRVSQIWGDFKNEVENMFNSGFGREEIVKIQNDKNIKLTLEYLKELIEGDYNEIRGGDCLDEIKKLKDNSVDCLIIDPPYGINFQSNFKNEKFNKIDNDDDNSDKLLTKSLNLVMDKLKKNSHVYIFTSWKVYDKIKPIIEKSLTLKNCIIWDKQIYGMGDLNGNYADTYEMILFAVKGNKKLNCEKRPLNIIKIPMVKSDLHPTEKPIDLLKELISNSTIEGEVVLDYFAGLGSTLLASKELKRKWIGIEKDKNYIDLIKSKLNKDLNNETKN
jgi:site-specific DNA-methyltransferase (adenine-specific)